MIAMLPGGVRRIVAPNASVMTGAGTNTYIIPGAAGGCLIVDPGPLSEPHLQAVAGAAAAAGGAAAIVVTHGHTDHSEGAVRLRSITGAPIAASGERGMADADLLLADGVQVPGLDRALVAVYTPGHRFDHLCLHLVDDHLIFAGDLVSGSGTVVIAPPEGNLRAYLASLSKVRDLHARLLLPGHGPEIFTPHQLIDSYIQHRLQREQQILNALTGGSHTTAAIAAAVYQGLNADLLRFAELSTTAHLLKLQEDGLVRMRLEDGQEHWSRVG